jgi:hypothetical protein
LSREAVFELLAGLVAKSLVVAQRDGPSTRYRQLATIREYGEERLAEYGETEQLRDRHGEYYCQVLAVLRDQLGGRDQLEASRGLAAEKDNLLAAVNHAIDTANVGLALRLVHDTPGPDSQLGFALWPPVAAVIALPGAASDDFYACAVALSAFMFAMHGDFVRVEGVCREALDTAQSIGSERERRFVEFWVASARAQLARLFSAFRECAGYNEEMARIALEYGVPTAGLNHEQAAPIALELGRATAARTLSYAAIAYIMAGEPEAGVGAAEKALRFARAAGGPIVVACCLVALAGTLADRDPRRARGLLSEALALRDSLDIDDLSFALNSTISAAHMADWPLTLQLADSMIRHLHWGGLHPALVGMLNVVARALVPTHGEAAARLQGAASHLVVQLRASATRVPTDPSLSQPAFPSTGSSLISDLRRQTNALLHETLDEGRLGQLRAEGEAMDIDQAAAYAVEAIRRARQSTAP